MDTRELLAHVRKIEIRTRKAVNELTAGAYHSVFKGKGIEFEQVREYVAGDEIRSIDWNVTARMRKPFIKQYVEERALTVYLLVDVSASGDFGTVNQSKKRLATEIAALLAFSAIRNNDRVGLLMFSNQEELHLPPRKGRRHGLRLIRELVACERSASGTHIRGPLETLMRPDYSPGIVFILSDFIDHGFKKTLAVAAQKHDIVAVRMVDRRDLELPAVGLINLEDAENGEQCVVATGTAGERQRYQESAMTEGEGMRQTIRRAGADLIDIRTDEDYVTRLMQFFRRRERHQRHL